MVEFSREQFITKFNLTNVEWSYSKSSFSKSEDSGAVRMVSFVVHVEVLFLMKNLERHRKVWSLELSW